MNFSYNWLQSYFKNPLPSAQEVYALVGERAFEPEGITTTESDTILDFDILPNRAHDCLCHYGLAKEIATLLVRPEITLPKTETNTDPSVSTPQVKNLETTRCRRYITQQIENVSVAESPEWLRTQLSSIGQRPINTIVDITNYVMFGLGQPMHAFDAEKVVGGIQIRLAHSGEKITLLGGEEKDLSSDQLVIADDEGPLAIAGIKGGTKAEVTKSTRHVILESANFEPVTTRLSSRALKIQTDSSKRFENEITPERALPAIQEAARLVLLLAKTDQTKLGNVNDTYPDPTPWKPKPISVSLAQINGTLGLQLANTEIEHIANRLWLAIENREDVFDFTPPNDRLDLTHPEDIIEEIGRVYGYEKIESLLPKTPPVKINKETHLAQSVRNWLLEKGWNEVMTYTFRDQGDIEMMNALASDKRFLRTNLTEGFQESLAKNLHNRELFGADTLFQFEIGSVFPKGNQETHLVLGFASARKKFTFNLEALAQELTQDLGVKFTGSQQDNILELVLDAEDYEPGEESYHNAGLQLSHDTRTFQPYSIFPFMLRDVSVWLPEQTPKEELLGVLTSQAGELLVREPRCFDVFTKEGQTSYAYRLVFQAADRTLTDEEVGAIMDRITTAFEEKGWIPR